MKLSRIGAIVLRQFYILRGSFTRIIPLFVWVGIDIILWGFITRYLSGIASPGFSFTTTMLGAIVLWGFLIRVMQGVSMAFMEDTWSRNFLNIFASPLTLSEYIGGLIITSIMTSAIGLAVMLAIAIGVFGLSYLTYGLMILPFLFILFLFGIALGILACAIMLRLGPAAEWFVWPIPALISPFVGVFYPLSVLPAWMQHVSHLLPPAYVFESMRAIAAKGAAPLGFLGYGLGLALFYIALAAWFFVRVYRHAVRTGLIARYTA